MTLFPRRINHRSMRPFFLSTLVILMLPIAEVPAAENPADAPGVVIDYVPAAKKYYVGCPAIAILPDGRYVASHSYFGSCSNDRTVVFRSEDRGRTWRKLTELDGQWWSNLFVHDGNLYIMGTSGLWGSVVIRRSTDGGQTWTEPSNSNSGLLLDDSKYHTAPVPVLVHDGRIWRAMEVADYYPERLQKDPHPYRTLVMSAPVESDLLKAESWTTTNYLRFDRARVGKKPNQGSGGWREGNILLTPEGELVNFLRIDDAGADRADVIPVSSDGKRIAFDDARWGLVDFPGGRTKFTIRFDPVSKRYWTLSNRQKNPAAIRNILVLASSADLKHWKVNSVILRHPDTKHHAFQYVDWQFDSDDLVAVSRTGWDGSHNFHDANYFTFHRVPDFRKRTMDNSPLNEEKKDKEPRMDADERG